MPTYEISMVPGMDRTSPSTALHQEGGISFARILADLMPERGELARRPGTESAFSSNPTFDGVSGNYSVVHIEALQRTPAVGSNFSFSRRSPWFLLATSAELYIGDGNSWHNITPEYADGTVTVTNGSATVTGSGTSWQTRGIYGGAGTFGTGNWFKGPDGTWYEIDDVASDTSLTLASNYAGGSQSGASYTIRRTFNLREADSFPEAHFLYTVRINEDLYVAGMVSGGTGPTRNLPDGGVIKVAGAFNSGNTSFAPSDVSFVTSGANEVEAGVDNLGYFIDPKALGALADGRLVVPCHALNNSGLRAAARVLYSSHINVAVWTTSPGGATDLIDQEGIITGAIFTTNQAAIHFSDGIEVSELTGQDDPPLRFRPSSSQIGAVGPRMLTSVPPGGGIPGQHIFVGADARVYSWNGDNVTPLFDGATLDLSPEFDGANGPEIVDALWAGDIALDSHRNELAILTYLGDESFDYNGTREIRVNYVTGAQWRASFQSPLYCVQNVPYQLNANLKPFEAIYYGSRTDRGWVVRTSPANASDHDELYNPEPNSLYALFEGFDAGEPLKTKVLNEVVVFVRAPFHAAASATNITLQWWSEYQTGGDQQNQSVTPARISLSEDYVRPEYAVVFRDFQATKWRELSFALKMATTAMGITISRIIIDYRNTGDDRVG